MEGTIIAPENPVAAAVKDESCHPSKMKAQEKEDSFSEPAPMQAYSTPGTNGSLAPHEVMAKRIVIEERMEATKNDIAQA